MDGWQSVAEMELDIYKPNSIQGGDNTPVLVSVDLLHGHLSWHYILGRMANGTYSL